MISNKKIEATVFSQMFDLPDSIVVDMAEQFRDDRLLFEHGKVSKFFCLKCGTKGETDSDTPICPTCGNQFFRSPKSTYRHSDQCESVRYIQTAGEHVLISEYHVYARETIENGLIPEKHEYFRVVLSEKEYRLFYLSERYQGAMQVKAWTPTKEVNVASGKRVNLIVADQSVYDNPLVNSALDYLSGPITDLVARIKLATVCETEQSMLMPKAEFKSNEVSEFSNVQSQWTVETRKIPIENSDGYIKKLTWCSRCGKFYKEILDSSRDYTGNGCKRCGRYLDRLRGKSEYIFHLIDAIELESKEIIIRVQGFVQEKTIAEAVKEGEDPVVETRLNPQFTNYIYVDINGRINFFNETGKSIEKLQIQSVKTDLYGHKRFIFDASCMELIKNNPCIKRTGYDLLVDTNTSPKFFEYLKEIPSMEIFAKSQMFSLIQDIMKKEIPELPAFIRGTGRQKSLKKLTKPQLVSLRAHPVTLKHLDAYLQCLSKDPTAMFEDFLKLSTLAHERHVLDILRVGVPGLTVKKIAEYIERVDDMQCCPPSSSMQLWADYLRMLRDSDCDMTDSKLVYTHSLKREHDKVSRKLEQIRDEKLVEAFEQKAADNEWLEYKGKYLTAMVPKKLPELYEEGRKLSHCVGTYARSIIDGHSIIVFLRKNTKLDVPYCTVEVRGKTIVQVRGWDNCEGIRFPDIKSFLANWSDKKGLLLDVA